MNDKLYNKFDHLSQLVHVDYRIDGMQTQFLELTTPKELTILITIPDGIFEWFVQVLDVNRNELHSDWTEHYGNPKEILKTERQNDIEAFVNEVLKGNLQFTGSSLLNEFYKNRIE